MDAYEHTRDFDRDGCIVGARRVTYYTLERWYVCRDCGGSPSHRMRSVDKAWVDWAECNTCGCRDFISQRYYDRQCAEYYEIAEKLPPELAALLPTPEQKAWSDEEVVAFESALPGWLSSVQREQETRATAV